MDEYATDNACVLPRVIAAGPLFVAKRSDRPPCVSVTTCPPTGIETAHNPLDSGFAEFIDGLDVPIPLMGCLKIAAPIYDTVALISE